ncbi:hypothetical protein OIDMADRAFT_147380 [Oidiodendron maius Zn]|uniref:Uncharacterized protein n=1 Tax=Oidiodendron maius (strain Zn) TaxID=913774 RepID=A0A0C3H5Y3_OIDMZ|nr:hypothetical protein OIDMADRAFT_147380 [Oidiodendron maius Zn]
MAATAAAYSLWRLASRPPDASGTLAFLRTPRDSKLAVGRDDMLERCDDCRPVRGTRLSAAADYPFGQSTMAKAVLSAWLATDNHTIREDPRQMIWKWPFQNGSYGSQDPATASLPCKIPCLAFVLAVPRSRSRPAQMPPRRM